MRSQITICRAMAKTCAALPVLLGGLSFEVGQMIEKEIEQWTPIIKALGIKPE